MKRSESIAALSKALSAMQGELTDGIKDKKGGHGSYADLAQILQIARPLLSKHKLSFMQFPSASEGRVTVVSLLTHESGEWVESELTFKAAPAGKANDIQAQAQVITYSRRYSITCMLGISQDDSDCEITREAAKTERVSKIKHIKQAEVPADVSIDMQEIGKDKAIELLALIKESKSSESNTLSYAHNRAEFANVENMPLRIFLEVKDMLTRRIAESAKKEKALAAKLKKEAKANG